MPWSGQVVEVLRSSSALGLCWAATDAFTGVAAWFSAWVAPGTAAGVPPGAAAGAVAGAAKGAAAGALLYISM